MTNFERVATMLIFLLVLLIGLCLLTELQKPSPIVLEGCKEVRTSIPTR